MADLIAAAADRTDRHVRELRSRYPQLLAWMRQQANSRGDDVSWPEWCWLPMGAPASYLQAVGGRPEDIGRTAAVGAWRLLGRVIVISDPDVRVDLPPIDPDDRSTMDTRIYREALLDAYGGACYYVVNPLARRDHPVWVYGGYVHLEYDVNIGRAELRILLDTGDGWDDLVPMWVHIDQPTVAMSVQDWVRTLPSTWQEMARDQLRIGVWWLWPLIMDIADESRTLSEVTTPGPAQVWRLSSGPAR